MVKIVPVPSAFDCFILPRLTIFEEARKHEGQVITEVRQRDIVMTRAVFVGDDFQQKPYIASNNAKQKKLGNRSPPLQ
jgi:hypothetical protein